MAKDDTVASTQNPVSLLWDRILFLPIVGTVDSKRAQDIMDIMLSKAEETRARIIILDIKGVLAVDSAVANHIIKICLATRLMGCSTIISGITPAVAQTLVHLGADLGDVISTGTVRDALACALGELGYEIRAKQDA